MPLKKSSSREAVSTNIKEMKASGRPQKQAVAAALSNQRRMKAKGFQSGGSVDPGPAWNEMQGFPEPSKESLATARKAANEPLPKAPPPGIAGSGSFYKKGGAIKKKK